MTTIVMLEGLNGTIHAAADRRISDDRGGYHTLDTPKLHQWDGVVIGVSGSYSLLAPLVEAITALKERTAPTIAKALREICKDADEGEWLDLLVGWKGHGIYHISGGGACFRDTRGFAAVGSGAVYALGALDVYTVYQGSGAKAASIAVEVASNFDTGTDDNVDVVTL